MITLAPPSLRRFSTTSLRSRAVLAGILLATAGAGLAPTRASAQDFLALGVLLPSHTESVAEAVSADGSVVVGYSDAGISTHRAFRWTGTSGMVDLGILPGGAYAWGLGVSDNGLVATGIGHSAGNQLAFRWTSATGMVSLGVLPTGTYSFATDINADGSVIVGVGNTSSDERPFRWTSTGGMVNLGALPGSLYAQAYGVSNDGNAVVGACRIGPADHAFRWTSAAGMLDLGFLPGAASSVATDANTDGSVVVGRSGPVNGDYRAFRWTSAGGMVSLGVLPGMTTSLASGVSANGAAIVGQSGNAAFLWTAPTGMLNLNTYLPSRGMDLSGWTLTNARAISADGKTIVGTGMHNGRSEAWRAHLPSCPADFNADGAVNSQDFFDFVTAFFAGC